MSSLRPPYQGVSAADPRDLGSPRSPEEREVESGGVVLPEERGRVLIVEDEQIVALELQSRLARLGHEVVATVASAEEAVDAAARHRPDLVLMDIKLQGAADGVDAARVIRNDGAPALVYVTAFADDRTLARAKATEPAGYLVKPFHERELRATIEIALYRLRMERRLRESERWRAGLLRSVGAGVLGTDASGNVRFMNQRAQDLAGWTEREAEGVALGEVLNVTSSADRRSGVWREPSSQRLIARNGLVHFVEVTRTPLTDERGSDLGAVWLLQDVSERKKQRDRERFLTLASGQIAGSMDTATIAPSLAEMVVRHGRASWCTIHLLEPGPRLAAFWHLRPEARRVGEETLLAKAESGLRDGVFDQVIRAGETRQGHDLDGRGWIASSFRFPEELLALLDARAFVSVPIVARGRTFGAMTLVWEDGARAFERPDVLLVEELGRRLGSALDNAQLYSAAQQAIRAREEILGFVSHDLRGPLSSIALSAEVIARSETRASDARLSTAVSVIQRGAESMRRLIGDLLDIAAIDSGHLSLEPVATSTAQLLERLGQTFSPLALARSIELSVQPLAQRDVHVVCDPERVLQVLSNLIGNALKLSSAGARVSVRAEVVGHQVQISVEDQAGGIDPEAVERIFEKYGQSKKTRSLGLGLGLYISRAIVERLGGRIWVVSRPGVGSTFHFTLPIATSEVLPPEA